MQPHVIYPSCCVIAALLLPLSTFAANAVQVQNSDLPTLTQTFVITNPGLKQSKSPVNALSLVRKHQDLHQVSHLRMKQYYYGFPVFRGDIIIHSTQPTRALRGQAQNVRMNGVVYQGLEQELGKPSAHLVDQAQTMLAHFKQQYSEGTIVDAEVIPLVYLDAQANAFWAYQVMLSIDYPNKMPEKPIAILDASTGKSLIAWDGIETISVKASAQGFGGNPRVGKLQYGKQGPSLPILRDAEKEMCTLETARTKVVDMQHRYGSANQAMQFKCSSDTPQSSEPFWTGYHADGYDAVNGGYSPTNDALYSGEIIHEMYQQWFGVPPLVTMKNQAMSLLMRVHYGEQYENAFWDGKQMTFGDGENMMYPLVSLEVSAHEISHGFTEQHSDLLYFDQPGGMNESFSDMAAQAAEYYATHQNRWLIGDEILKESSHLVALRYMDKPSKDGLSIDSADQFYPHLGVHYSSGVYNRFFYLLAHKKNWDTEKAFRAVVKANMDYWTPATNFEEGGCGVMLAAQDLGFPVSDVEQALHEVAIHPQHCTTEPSA